MSGVPSTSAPLVDSAGLATRTWYGFFAALMVPTPVSSAAADIAAIDARINTLGKVRGKQVYDTDNHRVMVADGSQPGDNWWVVDGSASVTPV